MSCEGIGRSNAVGAPHCSDAEPSAAAEPNGELLPDPFRELANSNDVGAQIAALLVNMGHEQKQSARASRDAAERAQQSAEREQLVEMRHEANMKLAAGIVEGSAKVASGTIGCVAAGKEATTSARLRGVGEIVGGSGKVGSVVFTHYADRAGADAKEAEHTAGRERRAADDARDVEKDAKQLMQRALEYYKEYLTAKNETHRASLLRA